MAQTALLLDLCAECGNNPGCVLMAHHTRPVTDCMEFCCPRSTPAKPNLSDPDSQYEPAEPTEQNHPDLLGLCGDCECRNECRLSKSCGGVWYCEEYQ